MHISTRQLIRMSVEILVLCLSQNSSNILNEDCSNLYMLSYFHTNNTIFEGVIALLHLEYFIRKFVQAIPTF